MQSLTFIDRVQRVALNFDYASFPVFSKDAAACRALAAGGRIPGGLSDHHVVRGLNQRVKMFFGGTAAKCKRNAAHAGNFKEGSPIHLKNYLPETV